MLSLEDCLEQLDEINWEPLLLASGEILKITNTWDRQFIGDVANFTRDGKALSTAQGEIVKKMVSRYRDHLIASNFNPSQIDGLLAYPYYRIPPHVSVNIPREVRWLGNSQLVFRCPFNRIVVDEIKKLSGSATLSKTRNHITDKHSMFVDEHKLWVVNVSWNNVDKVMAFISRHKFSFDEPVTWFLMEVANSKGKASSAELDGDMIKVTIRDDEIFSIWMNSLVSLGDLNV